MAQSRCPYCDARGEDMAAEGESPESAIQKHIAQDHPDKDGPGPRGPTAGALEFLAQTPQDAGRFRHKKEN